MSTLKWLALILGGLVIGLIVYAKSKGLSLSELLMGQGGMPNPAPPLTPDTSMYSQDTGKSGFVEACGAVMQIGGGLALAAGDPTTKAIGMGSTILGPLACSALPKIGSTVKNSTSGAAEGVKGAARNVKSFFGGLFS